VSTVLFAYLLILEKLNHAVEQKRQYMRLQPEESAMHSIIHRDAGLSDRQEEES
jgi:hypothetical protein